MADGEEDDRAGIPVIKCPPGKAEGADEWWPQRVSQIVGTIGEAVIRRDGEAYCSWAEACYKQNVPVADRFRFENPPVDQGQTRLTWWQKLERDPQEGKRHTSLLHTGVNPWGGRHRKKWYGQVQHVQPMWDETARARYTLHWLYRKHGGRYKRQTREQIMADTIDLSSGVVALCLGKGYEAPTEFAYHPQVHVIDTEHLDPHKLTIPSQTKVVVMTDHIPTFVYQNIQSVIRQRRLPYLYRKTQGAVEDQLKILFPKKGDPATNGNGAGGSVQAQEQAGQAGKAEQSGKKGSKGFPKALVERGVLAAFVKQHANLSKGSAEEGRRLFQMAQVQGIRTTLGSITQSVSHLKRKSGRGDIPMSAQPQSAKLQVLAGIDEAIAALSRIKDHAETLEKDKGQLLTENADLKARIQLLKEAFRKLD